MSEKRDKKLNLWVSESEKNFFESHAKKSGISLAEYVRLSLHRNIRLELAFQEAIKSVAKDFNNL